MTTIKCKVDGREETLIADQVTELYENHSIEILDSAIFCPCCLGGVITYRFFHPDQKGGRCNKCDIVHWHTNLKLDQDKQEQVFIKNHKVVMVIPLDESRRIQVVSR